MIRNCTIHKLNENYEGLKISDKLKDLIEYFEVKDNCGMLATF